ncbi:MAG TPA: TylF/MycF/NovP-related O-methyltransferase, partial [Clostridia bacterium]|nr:TylF/MycF/NovP-related O-methyltransferase [Clostridia bacterium]
MKVFTRFYPHMRFPTYNDKACKAVSSNGDPVRFSTIALALKRIDTDEVPGEIAEVGVWRGDTSRFIRTCTSRELHLFDTFEGFPKDQLSECEIMHAGDSKRFRDTSALQLRS